jgi:hypothetical protein
MALMQKKTPEQRAVKAAAKEQDARRAAVQKEADRLQQLRKEFLASPAGQAQLAFERGDQVFQYSIDVMNQQAIVRTMASLAGPSATTKARTNDPTGVLNSVCDEGWELVTGSFVFVEEGETSRKQALSSKVQVAVKGTVIGYYLFKRNETNPRAPSEGTP